MTPSLQSTMTATYIHTTFIMNRHTSHRFSLTAAASLTSSSSQTVQPAFITGNSSAFPRTFLLWSTRALIVSGRAARRVWKFAALHKSILQRELLSGFCWSLLLAIVSSCITSREIYLLKDEKPVRSPPGPKCINNINLHLVSPEDFSP